MKPKIKQMDKSPMGAPGKMAPVKKEMKPEHGAEAGDFNLGHKVLDSGAHKIRKGRQAHQAKTVSSQNYMEGIGAPGAGKPNFSSEGEANE